MASDACTQSPMAPAHARFLRCSLMKEKIWRPWSEENNLRSRTTSTKMFKNTTLNKLAEVPITCLVYASVVMKSQLTMMSCVMLSDVV